MTRAAPDTLLGQIQRGRGISRTAALTDRATASDYVVACIADDPRWDHQVESRDWLYATLITDLGVDITRLRAAYADRPVDPYGDDAAWLTTSVLDLLARRGISGSVSELRHYLRSGRDIDQALGYLIPYIDHPEAEGLLAEVLEVADDEQLQSAFGWRFSPPAPPEWRQSSARIERVAAAADEARLTPVPTHQRPPRKARSPQTLEWARANAGLDNDFDGTALSLYAKLAEPSDAPRLLEMLDATLGRGNEAIYDQCNLVEGIARLRHSPASPTVESIFDTTVYSYLRKKCALALSRCAPDFASGRAIECLDDCESDTREVGIEHANIANPEVHERIRLISEDPTEEESTRRAAALRIRGVAKG